ncbi:MAG: type IIL restriction-modification enzyme MmeI [Pseudomonadota bacterium]
MEHNTSQVEHFISRWQSADGSELANTQSFTRELSELLDVPVPDPARADTRDNSYVFERRVIFNSHDGSTSEGRIDCFKPGSFVLESKKPKQGGHTKGFGVAMLAAYKQAEQYARALPSHEGRPPFLVVVNVA